MGIEQVEAVYQEYGRQATAIVIPSSAKGFDPERERRLKHIDCAFHVLSGRYSSRQVGALFGVDHKTALQWAKRAVTYDDPEAGRLRKFFGLD